MIKLDVAIIGSGAAGLAAAVYASRAGRKATVFEELISGGQANLTYEVENYLGFPTISGPELMQKFKDQAASFDVAFLNDNIEEIKGTVIDNKYEANSIIIATGAKPKALGIKGEQEFLGKGVSYCATCDGNFFKGMDVAVVGGGNTAVEDALLLADICNHVYLVHRRGSLRADKTLQDRLIKNEKIEILWNSYPTEITGDTKVDKLILNSQELKVSAVFVAVGIQPAMPKIKGLKVDEQGFIITNDKMQTNIKNIYAAGDVRQKPLRQIITAAADGAIAGSLLI